MPGRRTDPLTKRAVLAVAAPTALVALAGTLAFAGPAFAANEAASSAAALPFPTSICGTSGSSGAGSSGKSSSGTGSSGTGSSSPVSSPAPSTPSTSPKPGVSAAPSTSATSAAPSAPSASSSTAKTGNNAAASVSASQSPSPSSSASAPSSSSGGGFWGWLNGIWTWITGSVQLSHPAAAPVVNAAYVQSAAKQGAAKVAAVSKAALTTGTVASASPGATCIPQSAVKKNTASSGGNVAAEIPWHLSTSSMTMYNLTYNGITAIKTATGSLQVLDFTASKVTLLTMVTYSHQSGGRLQYVDGGTNQTATLTNVHLLTTSMTADVLGLVKQTFTPASPGLLVALQGITIPIPLLFTNVEADNAFLNTQLIDIPGFHGHGN